MSEQNKKHPEPDESSQPSDQVTDWTVGQAFMMTYRHPDHPLWNMFFKEGKTPLPSRDFNPDNLNEREIPE